jgi:hypothetical protein
MTSELHPRLTDEARLRLDQRYTTRRDRRARGIVRFTADRREARRPEL